MSLISLDHVSKIYPKGTRPALDDVNLHIDRGDFVFLVGASGSGKTTLLSLLLREEEATDGEIHVAGNDLRRLTNRQVPQYRRSIGFIFQDYKLLNNKTVWQNVAFALEVIGTRRSTIRSLVPKVLQTVGLTGKENSYPHELSGGEQQRVTIARAYVNHPQILLADEPTGNLDPTTSLGIMEVLDAINRTGTTVVMATHNEEIVNSMRKRVVELHAGRIVRDEAQGSYDSALYFPDADVESKSQQAIGVSNTVSPAGITRAGDAGRHEAAGDERFRPGYADGPATDAAPADGGKDTGDTKAARVEQAEHVVDVVSAVVDSNQTNEGIARLANSVHSGRTGRYGEAFAPVEQTLTWGKGLKLDEYAEQMESTGKHGVVGAAETDAATSDSAATPEGDAAPQMEQPDSNAVTTASSGDVPTAVPSDGNPSSVTPNDSVSDDTSIDGTGAAATSIVTSAATADANGIDANSANVANLANVSGDDSGDGDDTDDALLAPPAPPAPPQRSDRATAAGRPDHAGYGTQSTESRATKENR